MTETFHSLDIFRDTFHEGLERLLEQPDLGTFILVAANSICDPLILSRTQQRLQTVFLQLEAEHRQLFSEGRPCSAAEDDLLVFLKMACVGFDRLEKMERRMAGDWEVQFNPLRSFRPRRVSSETPTGIVKPFNPQDFHFNKPFLRRESFWEGDLGGRPISLLYNKFPFVDFHGLLVPDRMQELPQWLREHDHRYIWDLCESLSGQLPGVGFGYNAYGAYASVNHLHFHMFLSPAGLPAAQTHWRHNGGSNDYPARCLAFDCPNEAWGYLSRLHGGNTPYNLLYTPGRLHCFPRKLQGSYPLADWNGGFAWYEMAGGFVAVNRHDFESLEPEQIAVELAKGSDG